MSHQSLLKLLKGFRMPARLRPSVFWLVAVLGLAACATPTTVVHSTIRVSM